MFLRSPYHELAAADFELQGLLDDVPDCLIDKLDDRISRLEREAAAVPGWRGQNLREDLRVMLSPEFSEDAVRPGRRVRGPVKLQFKGRTLDRPSDWLIVEARLPVSFLLDEPSDEAQAVKLIRTYEALAGCFCRWKGWTTPPPLPLNSAEQRWVQEHGEPVLPSWLHVMKVPKPRRSDTAPTRDFLLKVGHGGDLEMTTEHAVELIEDGSKQSVRAIVRGWYTAMGDLNTAAHRKALEGCLGRSVDDADYLALRSRALLTDPGTAVGADPGSFAELVSGWGEVSDLHEAASFTSSIAEIADLYSVPAGLFGP